MLIICRCTDTPDQPDMKAATAVPIFSEAISAACAMPPVSSKNPNINAFSSCGILKNSTAELSVPRKAVKKTTKAHILKIPNAESVIESVKLTIPNL